MFHRMMNYGEMEVRPTAMLTRDLIKKFTPKYKRHDDLIIVQEQAWEEFKRSMPIPVVKDENSPFSIDEDELASLLCQTIQKPLCRRLAIDHGVKSDDFRRPNMELVLGDHGIVTHKENHITYRFDVTKCMFSFGNISEKMRMAKLDCADEIVVDLFAGIGYFTIPLLAHARVKHLYACEWNPDAIDALKRNLTINKIESSRCTVIEGDNRINRPTDVAQRVILGILPSCYDWMETAFECVDKSTGAILHCHDLVETKQSKGSDIETDKNDKQASPAATSSDKISFIQSLMNQSISSDSSSHSTIEKLPSPSDHRAFTGESDNNTNSPILLDKLSSSCTSVSKSSISLTSSISTSMPQENLDHISGQFSGNQNDSASIISSHKDDSTIDPPALNDNEMCMLWRRGQALIDRIRDDVDAHELQASLIHIQPVKSYAPHIKHVVFDIKIERKSTTTIESVHADAVGLMRSQQVEGHCLADFSADNGCELRETEISDQVI